MYHMISGEYPFEKPDLSSKICSNFVEFKSPRFDKTSYAAKDLMRALLKKDPEDRVTAG